MKTLKARVTLVAALFALAATAVGALASYFATRGAMTDMLVAQQREFVERIAHDIRQRFEFYQVSQTAIAEKLPVEHLGNPERLTDFLRAHPILLMLFRDVVILDAAGIALADWPVAAGRRGANFADRSYHIAAAKHGVPFISEPLMGRALQTPLVVMTVPVVRNGAVVAVLSGLVDLYQPSFLGGLSSVSIGNEGYLSIYTRDGIAVTHPSKERIMQPALSPEILSLATTRPFVPQKEMIYRNFEGRSVLAAAAHVSKTDWVVIGSRPVAEIEAPIFDIVLNDARWSALAIIVLIPIYWFVVARLTSRLSILSDQVRAAGAAAGNSVAHIQVTGDDEVGALAEEFRGALASVHHQRVLVENKETLRRTSEARLRALIEGAPVGVFETDADGACVFVNDEWCRITGMGRDAAMGDGWAAALHPDDAPAVYAKWVKTAGMGKPFAMEYRFRTPKGETRWVIGRSTPIRGDDGKVVSHVGSVSDITERHRTELALKDVQRGFAKAQRIAHVGNWDWNIVTNDLAWTDEIYRIFGLTPQEFPATYQAFLERVHPDDRAGLEAAVGAALKREKPYAFDHRVVRPSGEIRFVQELGDIEFDQDGKPTRMIGSVQDVTDRVAADARLRDANTKLSQTVEALRRRDADQTALRRLTDTLQICRNMDEARDSLQKTLPPLFEGLDGMFALMDESGASLSVAVEWGAAHTTGSPFRIEDCWGLRRGMPHTILDPTKDLVCGHIGEHRLAGPSVCLPLTSLGRIVGLLHLVGGADQNDEDLRQRTQTAGDAVKIALQNLSLRTTLEHQALTDPLTGLYNRRYLEETQPRELHRARRTGKTIAVAMIDIDHFKRFNDSFGHDAGDLVLRSAASALQHELRRSDVACRYGGEEFAVLLPDCDADGAARRLEQIARRLRNLELTYQEQLLPCITFSAGISASSDESKDATGLIAVADAALYAAKRAGRDRIIAA